MTSPAAPDATPVDTTLAELDPFLELSAEELAVDDVARKARTAFRHFLGLLEVGAIRAASNQRPTWSMSVMPRIDPVSS